MGKASQRKRIIQAIAFLDCGEAQDAWVTRGDGHSGLGWYVHCSEYPGEGSEFLGASLSRREARRLLEKARALSPKEPNSHE